MKDHESEESADDDDGIDKSLKIYVYDKMRHGLFDCVLFAKKGNFRAGEEELCLKTLRRILLWVKKRAQGAPAHVKKLIATELKSVSQSKFDDEGTGWCRFWSAKNMNTDRHIAQRKQVLAGEEHAASVMQQSNTGERKRRRSAKASECAEKPRKAPTAPWTKIIASKTPMPDILEKIAGLYTSRFVSDIVVDLRLMSGKLQDLPKVKKHNARALGAYLDEKFADERVDVVRAFLDSIFAQTPPEDLEKWEADILDEKLYEFDNPTWREAAGLHKFAMEPNEMGKLCRLALKVVKATVPAYLREFGSPTNCLRDASTLECHVLSQFIHPLFKESVFLFARETKWISGEIGSDYLPGLSKGDGLGVSPTNDDIPVCYFEGTRLRVRDSAKKKDDCEKLLGNGQHVLHSIWKKLTESKRRLPEKFMLATAQSYETNIHLYIMEVIGSRAFCFDYDVLSVPRDRKNFGLFPSLLSGIIGWALLVEPMVEALLSNSARFSRKSLYEAVFDSDPESSEDSDHVPAPSHINVAEHSLAGA
ncbi:hypothetical protein HDU90_008727 [Geranomyces variabilis]|nr:hypothetical protein HDU90_008727 [Geranomyces variabilis]